MKTILLSLLLLLIYSSISAYDSNDLDQTGINKSHTKVSFYQENMQNTILILKETQHVQYVFPGNFVYQPHSGWALELEKKIRKDLSFYDVKSQKIDETVSSMALKTSSKLIQDMKPKIVVVALGENDGLYNKTIKDIHLYVSTIVQTAKKNNAKVILVGNRLPQRYGTTYITEFSDMYARIAKEYNVAYVPEDKFEYTYPLFVYSYSNPTETDVLLNKSKKMTSMHNVWKKVEQIVEQDERAEKKIVYMRNFYRFPQFGRR